MSSDAQLLSECKTELGLSEVSQNVLARGNGAMADAAATAADGRRLAFVYVRHYDRLQGPDGFARHLGLDGLNGRFQARVRILKADGFRVRLQFP